MRFFLFVIALGLVAVGCGDSTTVDAGGSDAGPATCTGTAPTCGRRVVGTAGTPCCFVDDLADAICADEGSGVLFWSCPADHGDLADRVLCNIQLTTAQTCEPMGRDAGT